jgi:hypothetical protein
MKVEDTLSVHLDFLVHTPVVLDSTSKLLVGHQLAAIFVDRVRVI